MNTLELLKMVRDGDISAEQACEMFDKKAYREMGFAKLDSYRKERQGFAEVVFCSGKADEHLVRIFGELYESEGEVLGTRADPRQAELLKAEYPEIEYDKLSGVVKIEKKNKEKIGNITVCTAGTADIAVAEEAALTAEFFRTNVTRLYDVGVSGIHRLFSNIDKLAQANCVVAAAGMEGALASVVGGLVDKPVIAVPTSVGYGANFGGLSALLTMINSCSNGVAVVNIDNGFGAGFLASQINRLAVFGK